MKHIRKLLIAFCLIGVAGAAQSDEDGLVYSDDHTLSCLGAGTHMAEYEACIGVSANACMEDTAGGFSTYGMGGCLSRELEFWDARLNQVYQSQMARAKQTDNDMDAGEGVPSQAKALRAMQRAWIPFRDATCDYERSQWGGGTGGGPAALSCLLTMTAKQVFYLEHAGLGG